MDLRIECVDAATTFPLRQRVLRPHDTHDELAAGDPDAIHFAAFDGDTDEVIGSAVLLREAPPWRAGAVSWRLRGMATSAERQGHGVGAAVVQALLDHVAAHGGGPVWCTARTPARGFYERAGFVARGDEWIDPLLGPHIAMERF